MKVETYSGDASWGYLLIGSFAAVGAAMCLGTLFALLRYHRTGVFPGAEGPAEIPTKRLVVLWARVALGAVLAVIGVIAIDRANLL